jgi:hypothetical protein
MQLQRYTTQELQELCTNIFYDFLSSNVEGDIDGKTNAHLLHENYIDRINTFEKRTAIFERELKKTTNRDASDSIREQLSYLHTAHGFLLKSNISYQKELYKKTGSTDFCRSVVSIPLDKKINSFYDDLTLQVVFYDDVTTLNGKFDIYEKLQSKEEREEFLMQNTEITNMGLALISNPSNNLISIIALKGLLNTSDPRVQASGAIMLPSQFSDFNKVTLQMISNIDTNNNDFKQWLQSKIDLDKEDLIELSSTIIRGDVYKIYTNKFSTTFYIRYVCRSTGRVYYNELSLENLRISKYFNIKDYDTYSIAWWNLNTLGGDPYKEKPVIRC